MMSAYLISNKIYLVHTRNVAQPEMPRTLPIGSATFTPDEAVLLAHQILDAAKKAKT